MAAPSLRCRWGLASYSLGPADALPAFITPLRKRYWTGRFVRMAGREILFVAVYLPPGEHYVQARRDTLQDLGCLVRQLRCLWKLVGD